MCTIYGYFFMSYHKESLRFLSMTQQNPHLLSNSSAIISIKYTPSEILQHAINHVQSCKSFSICAKSCTWRLYDSIQIINFPTQWSLSVKATEILTGYRKYKQPEVHTIICFQSKGGHQKNEHFRIISTSMATSK